MRINWAAVIQGAIVSWPPVAAGFWVSWRKTKAHVSKVADAQTAELKGAPEAADQAGGKSLNDRMYE